MQVKGKVRGRVRVPAESAQDAIYASAIADANIAKFVSGDPKKIVYVPGRLLSVVV